MRVLVCDDAAAAAERCAALIGAAARRAVALRGVACLALSGGRSPWPMLRELASDDLPWSDIHVYQADERIVAMSDPARTWTQLGEALLSRVSLSPTHAHPMPVDADDLDAAVAMYGASLERFAGIPAVLDLVHLGLGADGHAASLVPGDEVLEVVDRDVAVTSEYEGHRRMTLTYASINRAREIVWLVTGEAKVGALRRLHGGDTDIPASHVSRVQATIVADRAAAGTLRSSA